MCNRYWRDFKAEQLAGQFDAVPEDIGELEPNYNVAPNTYNPVVLQRPGSSRRTVEEFRWGLIPFYEKEGKPKYLYTNARAEGLTDTAAYKEPFKKYRCVVPASGFYEWKHAKGEKYPYSFGLSDGGILPLAGLYYEWTSEDGRLTVPSYSIVTTRSNRTVGEVHGKKRMPVILAGGDIDFWLNPENRNPKAIRESGIFDPWPDDGMKRWPVSQQVNSVRNNGPELIEQVNEYEWE